MEIACYFLIENVVMVYQHQQVNSMFKDLVDKANGYGMPGLLIDGNNVFTVIDAKECG